MRTHGYVVAAIHRLYCSGRTRCSCDRHHKRSGSSERSHRRDAAEHHAADSGDANRFEHSDASCELCSRRTGGIRGRR